MGWMTSSLAGLSGTQAVRVGNVMGRRTVCGRGALPEWHSDQGLGGGADLLGVRGVALGEMMTLHGRADACGLMNRVGARGSCCQAYQRLH